MNTSNTLRSIGRQALVLAILLFIGCSHSTSPNSSGTVPSTLQVGSVYRYDVWAYDLRTGDSVALVEFDTVVSTSASFFGRSGLIRYNDSARTMLPYVVSNESNSSNRVMGYMQSPTYYAMEASGDILYPAFLRIHDTTAGTTDSAMAWCRLPFGSKQPQSFSTWSGSEAVSQDAIRILSDSTFLLAGKSYPTRRAELQHVLVNEHSEVHIRLSYVPSLQTMVEAAWLLPNQSGQFVPVGGKHLEQIQ